MSKNSYPGRETKTPSIPSIPKTPSVPKLRSPLTAHPLTAHRLSVAKVRQELGDKKKTRLTQVYVNLYQPVSTSKPFLGEISLRKSWFCWPWTERWYCYHPCNCELPSNHLSGTSYATSASIPPYLFFTTGMHRWHTASKALQRYSVTVKKCAIGCGGCLGLN